MGAGILIRYLAEEGPASRLVAGCALACVSDNIDFVRSRRLHAPLYAAMGQRFEQPHVRAEAAMLSLLTYHSNYQAREHVPQEKSLGEGNGY
jgi:hypothetical protein